MLYKLGFLQTNPQHISNKTLIFWNCFRYALAVNKKTPNGKRRILSIIADDFTYVELESELKVRIIFNFLFFFYKFVQFFIFFL
jgi:hypothetical protein